MIINFDDMSEAVIKNFKGGELEISAKMFVDDKNRILLGRLIPNATIGLHTHETNSEIIYILSGKGKILYEGEYFELFKGMCHYCKIGKSHSLINDSDADLVFFAVIPEQNP